MSKIPVKKIDAATDLLKTISGSFRMQIICLLCSKGSLSVSEISEALDSEQSATSHQLAKLRSDEIVDTNKSGQIVKYSLATTKNAELAKKIITECGCLRK